MAPSRTVPGRHRKRPAPILPAAVGATLSAATLMTTVSGGPVPVPFVVAPTAVSLAAFKANAPTEWWRTEVPRRPVVKPEPVVAAPAQPAAVTQPTSAPLAVKRPVVKREPVKQRAAAPAPVNAANGKVTCSAPWLSGVKRVAQVVGCDISQRFGVSNIGGHRAGSREHGSGKALDFMCTTAQGNAIAEYLLANKVALGVQHVIWQQRINYGKGWQGMPNRGSPTANHLDHVHVLFK